MLLGTYMSFNFTVCFLCVFQVDEIFNVPGTGPVVGGTLER